MVYEKHKRMSMSTQTKRYLPPVVAIFLLLVGVVSGIVLVQQPQELRREAAAATSLSMSPVTQSKSAGDTVSYSVTMNTGENQIVGMDLLITYDPTVLTVTSISKGQAISAFDTIIRNTIDNTSGRLNYSLFTVDKTKSVSGSNLTVLTFTGSVKGTAPAGTHTITLAPETSLAALTESQNVVANMTNATLVVTSESTGETNTPVPTSALPTATTAPSSGGSNNTNNNGNTQTPPAIGKRGDLNGDGKVNVLDMSILLTKFLKGGGAGDLNGDGKINIQDLSILLTSWGK
jgi:hypothetical protein